MTEFPYLVSACVAHIVVLYVVYQFCASITVSSPTGLNRMIASGDIQKDMGGRIQANDDTSFDEEGSKNESLAAFNKPCSDILV
jgi:hypothetical protein